MSEPGQGLRVFISYARHDGAAFAEDLLAGLEAAGFDPFLDRHDIAAGEDWEARLGNLLQQADTVVYALTPGSVGSQRCAWEIQHAETLAKRVIPVVALDVDEAATPEKLRRLNYIFFSPGHSFAAGLRDLSAALRTDLTWVREHTRLGELATRWRDRGKPEALLLRATELEGAKAWLTSWKAGAPEATELHRAFINESDGAEQRNTSEERKRLEEIAAAQAERAEALKRVQRSNVMWGAIAGVLFAMALGGGFIAYQQFQIAKEKQSVADGLRQQLDAEAARRDSKDKELAQALAALGQQTTVATAAAATPASAATRVDTALTAQLSKVAQAVRQARIAGGWDIDVFYCAGAGEAQHKQNADAVTAMLNAQQAQQSQQVGDAGLSFTLGRIRVRPISETTNAAPGYQIHGDVIRAEQSEAGEAASLRAFVSGHQGPQLGGEPSGIRTPNYLSVFLCSGATEP